MKKWEEEQRKKAHNKKVNQAKATISKSKIIVTYPCRDAATKCQEHAGLNAELYFVA
jgi:hypothetical protein